jgi:murein DD-endopeptidase MepM/ murein hydrolase activator NlpD
MRYSLLIPVMLLAGCSASTSSLRSTESAGDIELSAELRTISARVAAGTTITAMLSTALADKEASDLIERARAVFDIATIHANREYRIEQWATGLLKSFEYEIDKDRFLRVSRPNGDAALVAEVLPIPKTRREQVVEGTVTRTQPSLLAAIYSAGETADLGLAVADILSGQVDFNNDVKLGDHFVVRVEKEFREKDVFSGYGPVQFAEFQTAGRRLRAIRFTPEGGRPAYFDEHGRSVRRFLLQSPLKFQPTITSRFSRSRLHPILGDYRAHLGVDYRAPVGAPVVAVADGVVLQASANGASGRMVHLRHPNGFETEYLHLSAIAVRVGVRVAQGDVIGRVGATGLATGPHLDYRVKKNGVFVNPLTASRDTSSAPSVPADQMAAFTAARDVLLGAIDRHDSQ